MRNKQASQVALWLCMLLAHGCEHAWSSCSCACTDTHAQQ